MLNENRAEFFGRLDHRERTGICGIDATGTVIEQNDKKRPVPFGRQRKAFDWSAPLGTTTVSRAMAAASSAVAIRTSLSSNDNPATFQSNPAVAPNVTVAAQTGITHCTLTPGDCAHDKKWLRSVGNRIRQWSVRRLMRNVFTAGEEADEGTAL